MPAYTVLEGEILKKYYMDNNLMEFTFEWDGQTIKWPVGSDRPAKRPVKRRP